jgi:DNA polymerase III subunit beta
MKIIAKRKPLAEAFATAASFASRQSVKPILQMVKIEAGDRVTLLGTDLEIGCRIACTDIEVQKHGSAMLPIDRIGGLLKESSEDDLLIESTKDKVVAKTDRGEFRMNAVDVDEFPGVATFDHKAPCWSVVRTAFSAGLRLVALATDTDSSRYALGGVLIEQDKAAMFLVATDGRRLARFQLPCDSTSGHKPETTTIIRDSQLARIAKSLGEGEVKIHSRANDVLFASGDSEFYARKMEGRFPDWRRMPGAKGPSLSVLCGSFLATIRQAGLMLGRDKTDSRSIALTFDAGTLSVKATAAERGDSEVEMPIAFDSKVRVDFDIDYLCDWLAAIGPEATIDVKPGDGNTCAQFEAFDGAANYILMPLSQDR